MYTMNHNVPTALLQAAHDIRSPLSALKVLMSDYERVPTAVQRELVSAVVSRIEQIAEDLLETQRRQNAQAKEGLRTVIESIVAEKSVEHAGRIMTSELESNIEEVLVSSSEIKRVISNLVNNAVEAGAQWITVEARVRQNRVEIDIVDNGSGLPPSVLSRFTAGEFFSWKKNGNGLGLSHAKRSLEEINGELKFFSTVGEGTRICMAFPKAAE